MNLLIFIIFIICMVVAIMRPWIDSYTDYRGIKHVVLWYSNFKDERKFINLVGSQE